MFLAFSAIESRKGALILIWACAIFTLYCLPWNQIFSESLGDMGKQIFLIDDWSWAGMMVPITIWYIASLKWMDLHDGWVSRPVGAES